MPDRSPGAGVPWKWTAAVMAFIALAAAWYVLPVEEWAGAFDHFIRQQGARGVLVFAVAYVAATVLLVPGWPLTVIGGLAYGVAGGFPLVLVSATVGATLAFLVSRYLLRPTVEKKAGERVLLKAIDRAVSENGWRVVGLLRLSPVVPFNLQNYLYGVTGIRFWHYVAATFVGMMPGTLMYVYLGAVGKVAIGGGDAGGGALKWTFFAAGFLATIAVAVVVTRRARRELDRLIAEDREADS